MADVTLRATRDFSYQTRRLKAGDTFDVPEKWARILVGIKKAEPIRTPAEVPPPPAGLAERAAAQTPAKRRAPRKRRAAKE